MSIHSIGYPIDHGNATQGIQVFEKIHDILTHVKNGNNIKHKNPNYAIFSLEVYCILLSFIMICTTLNVMRKVLLSRHRHELSLYTLCHQVFRNFFDLTTSHTGNVHCQSLSRTLQLSVLLSVTFLMAVYDSSFSNESILIPSVNVEFKR